MTTTVGRTAIVTGGARGIGAAIAQRLASDGMAVAVLDKDADGAQATAKEISSTGGRAVAVIADVTDGSSVTEAVETAAAELGSPTVLVNNAGVTRDNLLFRLTSSLR